MGYIDQCQLHGGSGARASISKAQRARESRPNSSTRRPATRSGDLSGIGLGGNDLTGWDFAGKNLTDAVFSEATLTDADLSGAVVRGASFSDTTNSGFTREQLYSTDSYQSGDLTGIGLGKNDLTGWDFGEKDLTNARFSIDLFINGYLPARLANVNFAEAVVRGAGFQHTTSEGFTAEQLYSTASYQSGDLSGIGLGGNDLTGWDFAGKNLTDAAFFEATFTDVEFSFSDLRGAYIAADEMASVASTKAAILPAGRVDGLALSSGDHLIVRDDNGYTLEVWFGPITRDPIPITVDSTMSLDQAAFLQMVFEDDDWASTISFEPDIPVSLDGCP